MLSPYVAKIQPIATTYMSTDEYPVEGQLREVIEIFATTFCIRLRPGRHYWTRNNLLEPSECKSVLQQLNEEGRTGHYRLY